MWYQDVLEIRVAVLQIEMPAFILYCRRAFGPSLKPPNPFLALVEQLHVANVPRLSPRLHSTAHPETTLAKKWLLQRGVVLLSLTLLNAYARYSLTFGWATARVNIGVIAFPRDRVPLPPRRLYITPRPPFGPLPLYFLLHDF